MLSVKSVNKVWDRGEHNAFTDLCWFKGFFWLVFREGEAHVSDDGLVVVLKSSDGHEWQLAAEIKIEGIDLRDPKIVVTPKQQLLMTMGGVDRLSGRGTLLSYTSMSDGGSDWSIPKVQGREYDWIWRSRFIEGDAYGVAYNAGLQTTTLYRMDEHGQYQIAVDPLLSKQTHQLGYPNEHDLFQLAPEGLYCLLRRDADTATAQLGFSKSPYKAWHWRDLGVRIGGPLALVLTNQKVLLAIRLLGPERTSLCYLDVETANIEELLSLPSGGDTSYAGLVELKGSVWCSYYSSHEGKTAIYVAEIALDES